MTTTHAKQTGNSLLTNLFAGGTVGLVIAITAVAYGLVIFSGELSEFLPSGLGILLLSSAIVAAGVSSLSAYPAIVASPQDTTIPVLALVACHITELMQHETPEAKFYTVITTIILNSLFTGAIFLTIGRFKWGELIRFIPYPVVAGFLSGIGILLIKSVFSSLHGLEHHAIQFNDLLKPDILMQFIPGLIIATLLFISLKYIRSIWVLPFGIVLLIALFYLTLSLMGIPMSQADAQGLTLGELHNKGLFPIATVPALLGAHWEVILKELPTLAALWFIDTLALLFSASGIELAISSDLDLNRELKAAGIVSCLSGLFGGIGGFANLGETDRAHRLGGTRRLVGWTVAGVCVAVLLAGDHILPYLPRIILVGVPLLMGFEVVYDWFYRSWQKFSPSDFIVVVLIVSVMTTVGYLEGVAVGLIVAIILFVIDVSRISVIKHELSGASYHSHVRRSPQQSKYLQNVGGQVWILELQGFIFFATANKLMNHVKRHIQDSDQPINFLILDFRQVTGLDSSAVLSFAKINKLCTKLQLRFVTTHLHPNIQELLRQGGCLDETNQYCNYFDDLDRGLEWCEAQLLEAKSWTRTRFVPLPLQLERLFSDPDEIRNFMPYLERITLEEGEVLLKQGNQPDSLYFLEAGQVSTFLQTTDSQSTRLRTLKPGTVLGEIDFNTQRPYHMTAISDQPSILYRLTLDKLEEMIINHPKTAAVFQKFMLSEMADRLAQSNDNIKNLLS
jgi:sulfate permease, SulP family